eukprot:Em0019g243a
MDTSGKPYVYQGATFPPELHALLEHEFNMVYEKDAEALREKITAIFCFVTLPITKDLLERFPNLKVVGNCAVGYNHVDLKACAARGIRVGYTPNVLNAATADMAWALLLAAARRVVEGDKIAKSPNTSKFDTNWYGYQVSSTTLGIIGMGRIGMEIAKRAGGFGMRILYYNRHKKSKEEEDQVGATYVPSLKDLLSQSDHVVLCAPASKDTQHMMAAEQFGAMKRTAIFVNVSRGTLVDQDALADALTSGTIAAAGLDVTDPEPLPRDHPLLSCPNVTITPHTGSSTFHTRRAMLNVTIRNIWAGIKGEQMESEVNLPSLH